MTAEKLIHVLVLIAVIGTLFAECKLDTYDYLGCFKDTKDHDFALRADDRTEKGSAYWCYKNCLLKKFKYLGLQAGHECWCGDSFGKHGRADNCNTTCTADANDKCGGEGANTVLKMVNFRYVGCYKDAEDRAFKERATIEGGITSVWICYKACKGFKYFGLEAGKECWCSNAYDKHGGSDNCNMPCNGDIRDVCGGDLALSVFEITPPEEFVYDYLGCFKDTKEDRDFAVRADNRTEKGSAYWCYKNCLLRKFKFFGLQAGHECWCGDSFGKHDRADNCDITCTADANDKCGGEMANTVIKIVNFKYFGCYKQAEDRASQVRVTIEGGVTSVRTCYQTCKGYKYFGLEGGRDCWCSNSYDKHGASDNCDMPCNGDNRDVCGGDLALSVFEILKEEIPATPTCVRRPSSAGSLAPCPSGYAKWLNPRHGAIVKGTNIEITIQKDYGSCQEKCWITPHCKTADFNQENHRCHTSNATGPIVDGHKFDVALSFECCEETTPSPTTPSPTTPSPTTSTTTAKPEPEKPRIAFEDKGCYLDDPSGRHDHDLPQDGGYVHEPHECYRNCRGYKYFGIQEGRLCFCGSQYGRFRGSSECRPCRGHPRFKCGGPHANSIYEIHNSYQGR